MKSNKDGCAWVTAFPKGSAIFRVRLVRIFNGFVKGCWASEGCVGMIWIGGEVKEDMACT